ncbi:MAG: glycoside hydrolase family 13 protein [Bacteroidales bacterium]|nr:glycoside hydrolase family 13 protein [Bacteroidales bacterium]MDD7404453.1 glycoside hydrolase family 13 protein [Bacteroidales bacterium]MDY2931813.1 glycoside hydrolase family 13 protein [Muribaculaceae bacterium]MDY4882180.1 glycoside hydrolase family 13 protein [Muribaculaceae bacterium]MDY5119142.1 glycoside hydrolase family 13 protein [Muribaculaceae bacterium]
MIRKIVLSALTCALALPLCAKNAPVAEPAFWWTGMKDKTVQVMINGDGVRDALPEINREGVRLDSVVRLDSPNYLLLYLNIGSDAVPGKFPITLVNGKKKTRIEYELRARGAKQYTPFSSADLLYLLMPDRFANGNTANDDDATLNHPVKSDRENPNGRHGGDIEGITKHLGYIDSLGVTAIWLTPVLENDMPGGSYHGYATTNYYKIDPRFGTNDDYCNMIAEAHKRGLKVVMDMIFNHSGVCHKWMTDMPSKDWYNHTDGSVLTNFRLSTANDPYRSDYDYDRTTNGWFVPAMPDLNQRNPHLLRYLTQSSIWWIEYAGIDGIRMDTHPYADPEGMSKWLAAVLNEYPDYNIVGECWYGEAAGTAFWQKGSRLNTTGIDSNLPTVMDFPTMMLARDAFKTQSTRLTGLNAIYDRLALDYLYEDPQHVLTMLDNHDSDRFLLEMPENLGWWKQAFAFMLTTRGIPQMYYGDELLMHGSKEGSDGFVRRDMPGGFPGDKVNAFVDAGRTDMQREAWNFISRLANWRRGNEVISKGSLKHFMPENGVYVYQRSYKGKRVVVMMNGTDSENVIDGTIYREIMPEGTTLTDILSGEKITIAREMRLPARALYILE